MVTGRSYRQTIDNLLRLHAMWLSGEEGGTQMALNHGPFLLTLPSGSCLDNANLKKLYAAYACIDKVSLVKADLGDSDLYATKFTDCDLSYANLVGCDLCHTKFKRTSLKSHKTQH